MNLENDFIYYYPIEINEEEVKFDNIYNIKGLTKNYMDYVILRLKKSEGSELIGEGFIYENPQNKERYVTAFDSFFNLNLYNIDDFNNVISYRFHYRLKRTNEPLSNDIYKKILLNRILLKKNKSFIQNIELKEDIPLEYKDDGVIYLNEHIYRYEGKSITEYDEFNIDGLNYVALIVKSIDEYNSKDVHIKYTLMCINPNILLESNKEFIFYNIYKQTREIYSLFNDVDKNKISYEGNLFVKYIENDELSIKKIKRIKSKFQDNKIPFLHYKEKK